MNYCELYEFLSSVSEKLRARSGGISLDKGDEKLPEKFERIAKKLSRLSDRILREIEDLTPAQPQAEESPITDELCEEAFREGLAANDFSVAFLQRQFRLKYTDACELQDALRRRGKIKRVFLAGGAVCKG